MLKITVDAGETTIAMSGTVIDIATDASTAMDAIYKDIKKISGEEIALVFKYLLQEALTNEDSPIMREKDAEEKGEK